MLLIGVFFLLQSRHFFLDASSDSLMLENDPELIEFREIHSRYGTGSSLLAVTFTPKDGEIFTPPGLQRLRAIREDLKKLPHVQSVITLLDVPLFRNPPVPIAQVTDNVRTLDDPETDIEMAKAELLASEAYRQQLISSDGKTALIAMYITTNGELGKVRRQRTALQLEIDKGIDVEKNRMAYNALTPRLRQLQKLDNNDIDDMLAKLRSTVERYKTEGDIRIGGEMMISNDMLHYIRSDLKVFGISIFLCIILILTYFFKSKRWVLAAVICCAYSTVVMVGLLGLLQWPVTVISSNFISLLLIMNMSLVIHLIVQYRELSQLHTDMHVGELLRRTVEHKWIPSLFTTLTTIAGFSSLILCDIKPVKDFGMMMSLALVVSIVVSFILFPSLLMLFEKEAHKSNRDVGHSVTAWAASLAEHRGGVIFLSSFLLIAFILFGMTRLTVENSFVDYFKESSEIYRGMVFIDEQLGGTTPLDVTISLNSPSDPAGKGETKRSEVGPANAGSDRRESQPTAEPKKREGESPDEPPSQEGSRYAADSAKPAQGGELLRGSPSAKQTQDTPSDDFDEFDEFDEFDDTGSSEQYWYTPAKLEVVRKAHAILERQPEIGKVWSFATLLRVTDMLNEGKPLDAFDLAIMASKLPDYAKDILVDPFVSLEDNQFRLNARIFDSNQDLRRAPFLKKLEKELNEGLDLPEGSIVVNGTLVLYNSVLQSLFSSQILTLGVVFVVLLLMFMLLFRSVKLALIALFPNLISALVVLGILGAFNIPLDIMTITIASISIGIAVDDTIHYIHRFREEFHACGNYHDAMHASHKGVGSAMFYTSVTIVFGFMLLVFSNFIPSILFGVLSSVAMVVALIGALTLLPKLIITFRPFGKEG